MDDEQWIIVDEECLDPEVELQLEFLFWVNDHPESSRPEEPSISFLGRHNLVKIELGGLVWFLQTPYKNRVAAEWSRRSRSFAVHRVEPALQVTSFTKDGEEDVYFPPRSSFRIESEVNFFQDDPFKQLENHYIVPPELRNEIRCKSFMSVEAVESAETFPEVLNALYEFSTWYIDFLERNCVEMLPLLCQESFVTQLFLGQSRNLNHSSGAIVGQAKKASVMCEVAAEAVQDAAEAAASMLGETVVDPEVANNSVSMNPQNLWAIKKAQTKAIQEGAVLQWCSIRTNEMECSVDMKYSWIECKLEVGEFLEDEEVARCVGISMDEPLIIKVVGDSKEVRITQAAEEGGHSIATAFLLPHIVRQYLQNFEKAPATAIAGDENLFVRLLQQIARYLISLKSICPVCGNPHSLPASLPTACAHTACQATLDSWASIAPFGMTNVLVPQVSRLPARSKFPRGPKSKTVHRFKA